MLKLVMLITIIFVVLKLTDTIKWRWVWVLSPLWIYLLIVLLMFCVVGLLLFSTQMF